MKKLSFSLLVVTTIALTSCHYGENEAKSTLERNEQYKTEKQDYSINRAGERGKANTTAPSATQVAPADTTKK